MSTAPEIVSVKVQLLRTSELASLAKDLNEAVYMACGSIEGTAEKHALQAVVDYLHRKLTELSDMIETAREDCA